MNTLVIPGLVLLVPLLLALLWAKGKRGRGLPYDRQEALFSPAERAFLGVLDRAAGDEARVFVKVRVADVLTPKAGISKRKWQQALNNISVRQFDYLLCHPLDLSLICAVELDDSGHRQQKRRVRDNFLKAACDSAGLPLLQIPASSHYQVEAIREQILPLLVREAAPLADDPLPGERREPTFNPLLLDGVETGGRRHGSHSPSFAPIAPVQGKNKPAHRVADDLFADMDDETEIGQERPHCPRCDAPLVEREARKGPHVGRLFMACSRFPDCRYAAPHSPIQH